MSLRIITNNIERPTIGWEDLTDDEGAEFDYIAFGADGYPKDWEDFVRYKGQCYHIQGEFMVLPSYSAMKDWDGYSSDSMFSGVLVKYVDGNESVIMATYLS